VGLKQYLQSTHGRAPVGSPEQEGEERFDAG